MDRLPVELVSNACKFLTQRRVKKIRLVSRKFACAASPHLFSRILLAQRKDVLLVFAWITQHPVYRFHVREILIDGSTYEPELAQSREAYITRLVKSSKGKKMKKLVDYGTVLGINLPLIGFQIRSHEEYTRCYQAQEEIRREQQDCYMLIEGLQAMPNATCLIFSNNSYHHLPAESSRKGVAVLPRSIDESVNEDSIPLTVTSLYRNHGPLLSACHALTIAGEASRITEFVVDHSGDGAIAPSFFHLNLLDAVFAFRRLRSLILAFRGCEILSSFGWHSYDQYVMGSTLALGNTLGNMLERVEDLHELELWFNPVETVDGNYLHIGQGCDENEPMLLIFLGCRTWPNLCTFRTMGLYGHGIEVEDFLSRHITSLRDVYMCSTFLYTGFWCDVVKILAYEPHVQEFYIMNCRDALNWGIGGAYKAHIRHAGRPYQIREGDELPKIPPDPTRVSDIVSMRDVDGFAPSDFM